MLKCYIGAPPPNDKIVPTPMNSEIHDHICLMGVVTTFYICNTN